VENGHVATGPNGEAVTDSFYFVHQPLAGNGSLTAALTSLHDTGPALHLPTKFPQLPRTQPWAKAGILVTAGTRPGSPYAAIMATPGHGVRMQYDFTHDIAGPVSAASPRWLRLTRSGSTLTGYSSADGRHWTTVGTVNLAGLPATVQAGLFVASPDYDVDTQSFGGGDQGITVSTQAIAAFDHVSRQGDWPAGVWAGGQVGVGGQLPLQKVSGHCGTSPCAVKKAQPPDRFARSGGTFTVAGSGDIAPFVPVVDPLQVTFYGTLFGAIAVIALGAVFITGEYRRAMIRTTLAASPRRGRVLAAKAIVIGSVTFAATLAAAIVAVPLSSRLLRDNGNYLYPVNTLTEVRMVAGTAAMLAVAAVLALAIGAMVRRSAIAVTVVIVAIVLPYLISVTNLLPAGADQWLMRLAPAAAFSIQQTIPNYPQAGNVCSVTSGCYPLAPWAGFAVLCAWAAAALALAVFLVRRRDA
jgi:ABC-type transport system involved in multi-copper enzyme maturation permease subunit